MIKFDLTKFLGKHGVFVDFETTGPDPTKCDITSMGVHVVDFDTGTTYEHYVEGYACLGPLGPNLPDEDTVSWMRKVDIYGWYLDLPKIDPLVYWSTWQAAMLPVRDENPTVWGCGPDYDITILNRLARVVHKEPLHRYTNQRCVRTVKSLLEWKDQTTNGKPHHALFDARHEAELVQRVVSRLKLMNA